MSASYVADGVVVGSRVLASLAGLIQDSGGEVTNAKVYTTAHFIHPQHGALIDAWLAMTDDERKDVADRYPRLHLAIFLACKATEPPRQQCDAVSKNGSSCGVSGAHVVHVSANAGFDGRVSSEVWR